MRKKVLFLVMSLSIVMLAGGCGKKGIASDLDTNKAGSSTEGTTDTEDTADTEDAVDTTVAEAPVREAPVREAYVLSDYITLGEYKGIEVTVEQLVVTDEDVDAQIQSNLQANATQEEVTNRPIQMGDTVNMNYEGLLDGVAFDGGTAEDANLTIGSGQFIEGFEEGLIGANKGDTLALDLTFPEVYSNSPEMAGQAVVFNVTVNSITTSVVPELTEDYVTTNTEYDSIDAYKVSVREDLEEANTNTMKNNKINSILKEVVENSEISSYPETLIEYYTYEMEIYYEQYAGYYGMKIADFITAVGMTEEQYNAEVKAYAESRSDQELVLSAIVEAEGMELTDAEYTEGLAKFVTDYGYESEEQLLEGASEEEIRESILWNKAIELITEQAIEL